MSSFKLAAGVVALACAAGLSAETITYTYDAQGRLVEVQRTGAPQGTETAQYTYDAADNRTRVVTTSTNAPAPPPSSSVPYSTLFSFETPDVGNVGGRWVFNPTGQVPTFQSRSGVAANGSDWGFHPAPDGAQVAVLQSFEGVGAIISLPLNGFVPGRSYRVRARLARRPGYGVIPVTIKQNGQVLGSFTPASDDFSEIVTSTFQATGSTAEVRLEVSPTNGDGGSGVDMVYVEEISSVPSVHFSTLFSFEVPDVSNLGGRYLYNPTGQVPSFQSRSGVARNGSDFGFHAAPDGAQAAFLQSYQGVGAIISLPLNGFVPGRSYRVHASLAHRPGYGVNPVTIKQNGQVLGTFAPASDDFSEIVTPAFQATGSTAEVSFEVSTTGGGDTGLDRVYVEEINSSANDTLSSINTPQSLFVGQSLVSGDGRFRLTLQTDANVGLYGPRGAKWATNTVGRDAYRLTIQGDGNLVLIDRAGGIIWATAVAQGPSRLTMQDDGNLVVYRLSDGAPVWASGTVE